MTFLDETGFGSFKSRRKFQAPIDDRVAPVADDNADDNNNSSRERLEAIRQRALGGRTVNTLKPLTASGRPRSRESLEEIRLRALSGERAANDESALLSRTIGQPSIQKNSELPAATRLKLGITDNAQEAIKVIKNKFPEGELVYDPRTKKGTKFLWRPDKSQPFTPVDGDFLSGADGAKFSGRELALDVIEFVVNDLPAIGGEIVVGMTPAGKGFRFVNILARAGGAAVGEILGEGGEKLLGQSTENMVGGASLQRAGGQAIASTVGSVAEKPLRGGINFFLGRGIVPPVPGAELAMQATKRLGLKELPAHVLTGNPVVQRIGRQSAAVSSIIPEYVNEIKTGLVTLVQRGVISREGEMPGRAVLTRMFNAESDRIVNGVVRSFRKEGRSFTSFTKSGEAAASGLESYKATSQALVSGFYVDATKNGVPTFTELNPLIDAARIVKTEGDLTLTGVEGKGRLAELVTQIEEFVGRGPDPVLTPMTDGTNSLTSQFDVLSGLRQEAFDLKTPPAGRGANPANRLARQLFNALDDTIEQGAKGADNPQFLKDWRLAQSKAKERFTNIEKATVAVGAAKVSPAANAARVSNLTDPANADNIRILRKVLPPKEFREVQDGVLTELLSNPEKLNATMQNARPDVLDQLLSKSNQKTLRTTAQQLDELSQTGLKKVAKDQDELGRIASQLLIRQDSRGVSLIVDVMNRNGGKNGPLGRVLAAGIQQDIIDKSVKLGEGGFVESIDAAAYSRILKQYKDGGLSRIVSPSELQQISDVNFVARALRAIDDSGTSLQAGEAASQAAKLDKAGLFTMFKAWSVGRILISKPGRRFLVGTGNRPRLKGNQVVQELGAATALVFSDAQATGQLAEDLLTVLPRPALKAKRALFSPVDQ